MSDALKITKLFCKSGKGACKEKPRYLGQALGSAKVDELICAACKYRNKFDIRVRSSNGQEEKSTS